MPPTTRTRSGRNKKDLNDDNFDYLDDNQVENMFDGEQDSEEDKKKKKKTKKKKARNHGIEHDEPGYGRKKEVFDKDDEDDEEIKARIAHMEELDKLENDQDIFKFNVEVILAERISDEDTTATVEPEYLVKYKELSYLYTKWIPEAEFYKMDQH